MTSSVEQALAIKQVYSSVSHALIFILQYQLHFLAIRLHEVRFPILFFPQIWVTTWKITSSRGQPGGSGGCVCGGSGLTGLRMWLCNSQRKYKLLGTLVIWRKHNFTGAHETIEGITLQWSGLGTSSVSGTLLLPVLHQSCGRYLSGPYEPRSNKQALQRPPLVKMQTIVVVIKQVTQGQNTVF